MLRHRESAAHVLAAFQQRQAFSGHQRVKAQIRDTLDCGIEHIEGRNDRLPINDAARSHTAKLSEPTDKNRKPETNVTQVF